MSSPSEVCRVTDYGCNERESVRRRRMISEYETHTMVGSRRIVRVLVKDEDEERATKAGAGCTPAGVRGFTTKLKAEAESRHRRR